MSAGTMSKVEWLERMGREEAAWEAIVAAARAAGMERPGAAGDWTFVDVLGHLNGWRSRTVDRLEAAARNQEPPAPSWGAELGDDTDEGVEAINRLFFERYRGRPADEVIAEARAQFRRMRAAVEQVAEADLVTPGRFRWLGAYPLAAVLDGSYDHLHEEHEPAIRAWLAGTTG
jgi:hypothetical protein